MLASGSDGLSVVPRPWGLGRRIVTAAVMFLGLGFLVWAAAGSNGEGRIAGAGSTLVNPILQKVSTAYQGYLAADRVDPNAQTGESSDWTAGASALDYDPVGSIGGLVRLADPAVTFAATEVPLTAEELARDGMVQFPLVLGAAAPVANLQIEGKLALDAATLAAIYTGAITRWNDPAIAALNAGVVLPDQPIAVHFRRDGSGTSYTFTGYLALSQAWTFGQVAQADWPVGQGVDGSRGMVDAVDAAEGAIGYAEVGQARRAGLTIISLIGADGAAVEPTSPSIRTAVANVDWSAPEAAQMTGRTGWPMTATVWIVMRRDDAQNDRALGFFRYFYAEAARQANVLGYVALPAPAVSAVEKLWAESFNSRT